MRFFATPFYPVPSTERPVQAIRIWRPGGQGQLLNSIEVDSGVAGRIGALTRQRGRAGLRPLDLVELPIRHPSSHRVGARYRTSVVALGTRWRRRRRGRRAFQLSYSHGLAPECAGKLGKTAKSWGARPAGFELATSGLESRCSIRLSCGRDTTSGAERSGNLDHLHVTRHVRGRACPSRPLFTKTD